jgi:hypothetical protein
MKERKPTEERKITLNWFDRCSVTAHHLGLRLVTSWTHPSGALPRISLSPLWWHHPSVTLPAFHSPPPTHNIQGVRGWYAQHREQVLRAQEPSWKLCLGRRQGNKSVVWSLGNSIHTGGLTSAAGLEDVSPRALGHRQRGEYLQREREEAQHCESPAKSHT